MIGLPFRPNGCDDHCFMVVHDCSNKNNQTHNKLADRNFLLVSLVFDSEKRGERKTYDRLQPFNTDYKELLHLVSVMVTTTINV